MTALVRFDGVSLAFGDQPILKSADLAIDEGERVCLIGRNGAGKTTIFRLIASEVEPDAGKIEFGGDIGLSQLAQALPAELEQTVRDFVTGGLVELQRWLNAYHALSEKKLDKAGLNELAALERRIESHGGWNISQRVDTVLTDMDLPADAMLNTLSGGWRRRVALARALVSKPDLLLLDEPTNHLDLATIEWLENRVRAFPGSVLFITHDRAFVKRLATRIVELDRTRLISWPGSYDDYRRRKEKSEAEQQETNKQFDKRLAEEEAWIRQGIKARRTRNEGRVRALEAMREEHGKRLPREQQVSIQIGQADASGRKVIRARNVSSAMATNA